MPPRLKSLELHGYKTFASRTDFQFPGIITAIVGPNGSGKSNIADALRWVLGEQSYSLLRGRKTEDMIFSGSEQRSRAGMASATITFDNSDNWLPIDFSEVSITRRAYRDGQNEYLLNGQKVRLREISELLARSGLSERTYTIIGQGLVDAALALKPEERRRLFEEAAGIGLYRSRRDESINRLDVTRRNLERVQDILVEVEPRLRSLEKQAKRVQEYERLRGDLKNLLRDWYGYQWQRTEQDLAHAREVLRIHEEKVVLARENSQVAEYELNTSRTKIQEIRLRLTDWHNQSAKLHLDWERVNRDLAIHDERQKALLEQRQNHLADLARLEEEIKSRQELAQKARTEHSRLQVEQVEAQQQVGAARNSLSEQQKRRAEAEKEIRTARQLLTQTETRLVQLKAHQDELANRLLQQNRSFEVSTKAVTGGQSDLAKAETTVKEAEELKIKALRTRESLANRVQTCQKQLTDLETSRRKLIDDRNQLEVQRSRLTAQLDVCVQAERNFSGLAEGTRSLLLAAKQGKVKGSFHPITNLLDVPAEYEMAIAASLGESLDVLFLNSGTDPEQTLQFLENSDKGRAALLPLEWLAAPKFVVCPDDPACVGIAAKLVNAPPESQSAINVLLGRVLVIRDRSAVRRLMTEASPFTHLVTLQGEVFQKSGIIFAGKERRGGMLSQTRQKREFQNAIDLQNNKINEISQKITASEAEVGRVKVEQIQLEKENQDATRQLDRATDAAQRARMLFEQTERQLDWQTAQIKNLDGQIAKTKEELQSAAKEIAGVEAKQTDFRDLVRQINQRLANLPLDEFQAQVNHWNTVTAVTARAVKDAKSRINDHQQVLTQDLGKQSAFTERIQNCATALDNLDAEKILLHQDEANLSGEIVRIRDLIDPEEKDLEFGDQEFSNIQQQSITSQQNLTLAERLATQAQLELSRQRESMDHLRRRIEEDFGLVEFEYTSENVGQEPLPFEEMVEQLPAVTEIPEDLETNISRLRGQIRRLGAVNVEAQSEYIEVHERYEFMTKQVADLQKADADLRQIIAELDELMKRDFRQTFDAVAKEFHQLFSRLFEGGNARLLLQEGDNPTEPGIEIETKLPGKRQQGLSLLSGGERSLTAVALVFALLRVSPTPFCVMDEVDAMLDEANVGRFRDLLKEFSASTQFIVITHNRNTVQAADVIYGVTMGRDSSSQVISLRMDEISDEMVR